MGGLGGGKARPLPGVDDLPATEGVLETELDPKEAVGAGDCPGSLPFTDAGLRNRNGEIVLGFEVDDDIADKTDAERPKFA